MKAVYKILNNQDKVTMKYFYQMRCDPDLDKVLCAMRFIPCACTGCVEKSPIPGYLAQIKPSNHVMLLNPKHVSTLPSYGDIINGIFPKLNFLKDRTKPYEMEIKDELVLYSMTWSSADEIEYNTIGAFQTRNSNTPGYYIVRWTSNAYTLQEKYTYHSFYPPIIIP